MATSAAGDEDADPVLSDVEEDDPAPISITVEGFSVEKFRELLAELDLQKKARDAAETAKSELQVSFGRLKALAHEAIKKRDEAVREKDKISSELIEANKSKEEISKQFEEVKSERDELKSEIENSRHMLVSTIEKISGKVSNFRNFAAETLPRSQKYNGLPGVCYGVIKRANEIVEELLKQVDFSEKAKNEAREQMEQRNYEIAIEVSQLEATISGLREDVAEKTSKIERLERRVSENERESLEKRGLVEKEVAELRELVSEYDDKVKKLEAKIELQRPLLVDQLNFVAKIHDRLYDVIKVVDVNHSDSEFSESLFLPQQTDVEENLRACLAGMESIHDLTRVVVEKTRDLLDKKNQEVKSLNETVDQLVKEKEQIGSLLRSALSKRMSLDPSLKKNELFQSAENGLREAGIDFKFSKVLGDGKASAFHDNGGTLNLEEDEIYTLAEALENIVKASQLEIIELRHSVEELRAESSILKEHIEAHAKELDHRLHKIEELEEKERVANESVEGLMMDIAAAEEEIVRWKVAAEEEAAAGRAVEQEFLSQLSGLKQELEEARQAMLESEKKLKFKEETAAAAMAAREAAEKSLIMADTRASRLRDRVEELSRQLEEFETREDLRGRNRPRYVCWPWEWLGMDFVGFRKPETEQQSSNEMELSEPLL